MNFKQVVILTLFLATPAAAQQRDDRFGPPAKKGAKIGAVAGAVGGGAFGGLIGYLAWALCDSGECGESLGQNITIGTIAGAAAGAAGGAIIGSVIGASTVHGSASFSPVYARANDERTGDGFGVRALYALDTKHVSVGPEVGFYKTNEVIYHVGGAARFGLGNDKRLEPFASLGAGLYNWEKSYTANALGGYSIGAGVQLRNNTGRRTLFGEARWQDNLTNSGSVEDYGFYSLALGVSHSW